MTQQQLGIIALIKSALTGENVVLPSDFDLSEAVKLAKKHEIMTILYYGALNCGFPQSDMIMQELFINTCKTMAASTQQMFAVESIFSEFNTNQIEYMPLKGTLIKKMYPKSEMRIMGDADILINTSQYNLIKPIMSGLGFKEKVESDHELTWIKDGICIELHKRIIPSYNKDYYAYFGDGWRLAQVKDGTRYSMTNEDQMIYLFTHFAKHYRDAGIGIRHIVDLWVYRNYCKCLDEKYIEEELKKLQLFDFYKNIIKTLSVWFEDGECDNTTELITQVIFNSGVYGTHEAHILSDAVKTSKGINNKEAVQSVKLIELVFLPLSRMKLKYPILRKLPFLLPLFWLVRGVSSLFLRTGKIKKNFEEVIHLNLNQVDEYEQALNMVGLDFNFKE